MLQLSIKKNAKMREAALREEGGSKQEPPPMIYVPLPTWKETKERIKLQIDLTRKGFQQKSREWEEKEQVSLIYLWCLNDCNYDLTVKQVVCMLCSV